MCRSSTTALDCASYELSYASEYVGIEEQTGMHAMTIVPNPSPDRFIFQSQVQGLSRIQITDVEGRLLMDQKLNGDSYFTWDASDLHAGTYIARILTLNGTTSSSRLVRIP
jgi:hypothetical protein